MHLQCFPPTFRECALFWKPVLLDHVLAEYGLGYSVWFLDMSWVKRKQQLVRVVPKCVAGFVYTERGKSTKDTVNSRHHMHSTHAHTHTHTHTHNTYLHVHTHTQTPAHSMVIQHFASLQLQIWSFHEHMHKHHNIISKHFLWHFFCLVCGRLRKEVPNDSSWRHLWPLCACVAVWWCCSHECH